MCGRPNNKKDLMRERCKTHSRSDLRKMRAARLKEAEEKRIETMASSFMNEPNIVIENK